MRSLVVSIVVAGFAIAGCHAPCQNTLPPASMMMHPGPGVDGPGPGVMMYQPGGPVQAATSQVAFVGPEGMAVAWDVSAPGMFDSQPLTCPGRYNFPQGAIYRLKLGNIPGRAGVELYPTLEIGPAMPRTEAFLAHNALPVQFTEEDFDQVLSGNFVTKVIYLPDPEYQELALAGVETLVSTRLDPGVDPIVEADRRGAILGIVRLGNKDLQVPGGQVQENGVARASYQCPTDGGAVPAQAPMPMGAPVGGPSTMPGNYIAGVNAPQYGMPTCGTPIGLPGPPSVPMGVPAGLRKHVIKNHTCTHLPKPTETVQIDVKQVPGYSYPKPVDHVRIVERTGSGLGYFKQPLSDKVECVKPNCASECEESAAATTTPAASEKECPTE
ncbi:MAG: hypothetical protein LLF97_09770 [Planctomycetaceae bacterium]|nr:hypothetical protein [Planctomycetaceae bacterium]